MEGLLWIMAVPPNNLLQNNLSWAVDCAYYIVLGAEPDCNFQFD